jgi:hypothetical protein
MQPDIDKRPALIRDWWHELQSDPGARAKLRRCRTPIEAQALPTTIDLMVHLDVVDGDLGLFPPCDDQVLLLSPFQFQIPSGYTVDTATG